MAARPADLIEPLDGEETGEEFSRKKKSKFQTFKNFFAKKKKKDKEPSSPMGGESKLKPSQSSSDVNSDSSILHLPAEPGSKGSMGNKALSHDSVFISESLPDVTGKTSSQENLPGKVKALQLQLQKNLRLGSPPLAMTSKKIEDMGTVSEDDGLPRSPPEISTLHDILTCSMSKSSNPVQRHSSLSLGGTDSDEDQVPSECSSRPLSPLSSAVLGSPAVPTCHLLPVDFSSPAIPPGCLDTSAARHRIAMNPRKQKAFANKSQNLSVEKEQCLLGTAEGKTSHAKLLEESDSQEEDWEGPSIQNASHLNGAWADDVLPVTVASDALCYSWNADPGADGVCILPSEDQNLLVTYLRASVTVSCPKALSSLTKCEEGEMEEEVGERTGYPISDLELNPQGFGKEVMESTESLQTETEASALCDTLLSVLHGHVVGEELDTTAEHTRVPCLQPVDQKAKGSSVRNDAVYVDREEDRLGGGNSSPLTLEADPALPVPQFPSSTLEVTSQAEKAMVLALENSPTDKEDAGWAADMELQLFEGRTKPTITPQGGSAILDGKLDSLQLQSAATGEKPFLLKEIHCSDLSSSLGKEEADAFQKPGGLSSGGLPSTGGPAEEDASKSSLPDDNAGDQSGCVRMREESRAPDDIAKAQAKSASAKPVRFTIAPAWQRSLSGGSNSVDSSCSRSTPSSPIRPELFEGMPQLDTAAQGCILNSPERLERGNGNIAANLNSALEWSSDEGQGCESPFGVKLRRTSSLLKYQAEQQQHEPPKQVPPAASGTSNISVKDEATSPGSGTLPQNLIASTKALVTKSTLQEDKNPLKAKPEEGATKQQTGRPSEQTPAAHLETPSSEPTWILMAKLKQKGFQGHALAKGQRREAKPFAKTEQEGEKRVGISQQEKEVNPTGENVLKKSSAHHTCTPESKVQSKVTASLAKVTPARTSTQEAPPVEKEARPTLSLPMSSCSPAEPPWLSLAKKKAKAWSEMPQIVQ